MKLLKAVALSLLLTSTAVLAGTVDINSADARTIATQLEGIGPKTAAAIVAYRDKHGPFKSVDDLKKVKGVGDKTLSRNRERITVGRPAN